MYKKEMKGLKCFIKHMDAPGSWLQTEPLVQGGLPSRRRLFSACLLPWFILRELRYDQQKDVGIPVSTKTI